MICLKANKIKITKIKDWNIYFDYEDKKYLVHKCCDCYDESAVLYERIPINDFGKYKTKAVGESGYAPNIFQWAVEHNGNGQSYKKIDTENFLWVLTWDGLIDSKYTKRVPIVKKKLEEIDEKILNLRIKKSLLCKSKNGKG